MTAKFSGITVRELIKQLQGVDPNAEVIFGTVDGPKPLTYYRVKERGPGAVQIEFGEIVHIVFDPND